MKLKSNLCIIQSLEQDQLYGLSICFLLKLSIFNTVSFSIFTWHHPQLVCYHSNYNSTNYQLQIEMVHVITSGPSAESLPKVTMYWILSLSSYYSHNRQHTNKNTRRQDHLRSSLSVYGICIQSRYNVRKHERRYLGVIGIS